MVDAEVEISSVAFAASDDICVVAISTAVLAACVLVMALCGPTDCVREMVLDTPGDEFGDDKALLLLVGNTVVVL